MAWSALIFRFRLMQSHRFRNSYEYIYKYGQEMWRRWLGLGGLTAATGLSFSIRASVPTTFKQDATKLQLGAVQPPSHEQLIRQASTMTVDAATQLLSQTVLAYIETSKQYREALEELVDLVDDDLQVIVMETGSENNCNTDLSHELWEREVDVRGQVNDLRITLLELASYMEYVTKVATAAAEASFLAGSEFASTNMCERLNSAHRTFEEEKSKNKEADREFLKIQENSAARVKAENLSSSQFRNRIRKNIKHATLIDPLSDDIEDETANKAEQ